MTVVPSPSPHLHLAPLPAAYLCSAPPSDSLHPSPAPPPGTRLPSLGLPRVTADWQTGGKGEAASSSM